MEKPIMISGIQPTGNLHIGNYLGAVKNWVDLQNSGKYKCFFFIADLHALTGNQTAKERHDQIFKTAVELIAAGIDPEKSTLFVQSYVPEHTELSWIFHTLTPMSELERMTQYKDKSKRQAKNINAGLFTYPILQAADVLLYQATHVPVGQDQVQHIELVRDIAKKFNNRYGEYFRETKALLTEIPKVKSLLEPESKMSKSKGEGHVLELADEPEVLENKIKKAVTATGEENSAGVENLLLLLQNFGNEEDYKTFLQAKKDGSIRYGDLKNILTISIGNYFSEFRKKRSELMENKDLVAKLLAAGAAEAQEIALKNMEEIRSLVGIR